MTHPDDALPWRVVSAAHHIQAVTCSTVAIVTKPDNRLAGPIVPASFRTRAFTYEESVDPATMWLPSMALWLSAVHLASAHPRVFKDWLIWEDGG
jgi:hypothetical protein